MSVQVVLLFRTNTFFNKLSALEIDQFLEISISLKDSCWNGSLMLGPSGWPVERTIFLYNLPRKITKLLPYPIIKFVL